MKYHSSIVKLGCVARRGSGLCGGFLYSRGGGCSASTL